ncbi:hypothetical protein [Confluentibacter sediminis]|uniref:hypothetical protein n=1 Tax=Confluentibacter sediminis TaxID=2219045 RepID=UPI000DADA56C|nr:hypothetical protein [Confluentibacter sediminis]
MKQKLLLISFITISSSLLAQTIKRVGLNGLIFADSDDVEAITVYNKSSNKGTITNNKGEFVLAVAENDIIEISALQFGTQIVNITKEVIELKSIKIHLVEQVNQLNAVLLTHGLSGNLLVDIDNVQLPPKIEMNIGSINALELYDDRSFQDFKVTKDLNAMTNKGGLYNGADFVKIASLLFKPKKRTYPDDKPKYERPKLLIDIYSQKHIGETFNIPQTQVEGFIAFVENNGMSQELLDGKHEFELIDFLVKQSELFLKQSHVKK